jgi:hypothetical protein
MPVQSVERISVGSVGVQPGDVRVLSTDDYDTVVSTNYLESSRANGFTFYETDVVTVSYDGGFGLFQPTLTPSTITLLPLPTSGSTTLPTTDNHIATYANIDGDLTQNSNPAINGGSIQAGLSGTAGTLTSYPATGSKGYLRLAATANTGDTASIITNQASGQATTYTLPDVAAAAANIISSAGALVSGNFLIASGTNGKITAPAAIHSGKASYAGGGTSLAITGLTGVTTSSVATASIAAQSNTSSIIGVAVTTGTITITFSADPGADTVVSYIYTTIAV